MKMAWFHRQVVFKLKHFRLSLMNTVRTLVSGPKYRTQSDVPQVCKQREWIFKQTLPLWGNLFYSSGLCEVTRCGSGEGSVPHVAGFQWALMMKSYLLFLQVGWRGEKKQLNLQIRGRSTLEQDLRPLPRPNQPESAFSNVLRGLPRTGKFEKLTERCGQMLALELFHFQMNHGLFGFSSIWDKRQSEWKCSSHVNKMKSAVRFWTRIGRDSRHFFFF